MSEEKKPTGEQWLAAIEKMLTEGYQVKREPVYYVSGKREMERIKRMLGPVLSGRIKFIIQPTFRIPDEKP